MTSRITYNGKTIDFPKTYLPHQIDPIRRATRNQGMVVETLNVYAEEMVSLGFSPFKVVDHATFKRHIEQWWQWAQEGYAWRFAKDSTKVVLTTITGGAAAGASSVTVLSATGIAIGDVCILRTFERLEKVKVTNVAGTTITLEDTLNFGFAAGARFRSAEYWPGRLLENPRNPVIERPKLFFELQLEFSEDLNDLTA